MNHQSRFPLLGGGGLRGRGITLILLLVASPPAGTYFARDGERTVVKIIKVE